MFDKPNTQNAFLLKHVQLLHNSFQTLIGKQLIIKNVFTAQHAKDIFDSNAAIVSHNSEKDPILNYANQTALKLFEMNWQEFTQMPSRLSAELPNRLERENSLKAVTEKGFINNYTGVRISRTGKRFSIRNAIIWNLIDTDGCYKGQAAMFEKWKFL